MNIFDLMKKVRLRSVNKKASLLIKNDIYLNETWDELNMYVNHLSNDRPRILQKNFKNSMEE